MVFHVHNFSEVTLRRLLLQADFKKIKVGNSPLTPGNPYEGTFPFSTAQTKVLKGVAQGISASVFYGTLGRRCVGSSLLASCQKG